MNNLKVNTDLIVDRIFTEKLGKNDVEVEIYINNKWVLSTLTNVLPGDFWQVIKNNILVDGQCFQCLTKAMSQQNHDWDGSNKDLTFIMGVNHVVQAPAIMDDTLLISKSINTSTEVVATTIEYTEFKD